MIDYYIAGPMRGYARWNFPAFREACAYLRSRGCSVVSPHELDEAIGFTEDTTELPDGFMAEAMRRDVEALLEVDRIVLLPGWENSTGTRFELSVARMLGLYVAEYDPYASVRLSYLSWDQVDDHLAAADALANVPDEVTLPPLDVRLEAERYGGRAVHDPILGTTFVAADTTNPKDRIGQSKPPLHLVPQSATIRRAQAFADGARKYGPFNWRTKQVSASVYMAALLRHAGRWFDGEDIDPDSGIPHLGHAGACIDILIDATETGNLVDDRPAPGAASRLITELTEAPA